MIPSALDVVLALIRARLERLNSKATLLLLTLIPALAAALALTLARLKRFHWKTNATASLSEASCYISQRTYSITKQRLAVSGRVDISLPANR
jgi:hypothetical protein